MSDLEFMDRCLELAQKGRGLVGNGACVGAVLVREGRILAEGWHRGYGFHHAERDLLLSYHGKVSPSDILYVNLEPCCPAPEKKTPPCTEIILERGVKNLVYGMKDPDVRIAGRGVQALEDRGVLVRGPIAKERCILFNRGYVALRTLGSPWISLYSECPTDISLFDAVLTDQEVTLFATVLRVQGDGVRIGDQVHSLEDPKGLIESLGTPDGNFHGVGSLAVWGSKSLLSLFSPYANEFMEKI